MAAPWLFVVLAGACVAMPSGGAGQSKLEMAAGNGVLVGAAGASKTSDAFPPEIATLDHSIVGSAEGPVIRTSDKSKENKNSDLFIGDTSESHTRVMVVSFVFLTVTWLLFTYLLVAHLRNFKWPSLQKFYVRIAFLLPVYSTFSWWALSKTQYFVWYGMAMATFDSYVLLNFAFLMITYCGGLSTVIKSGNNMAEEDEPVEIRLPRKARCVYFCEWFQFSSYNRAYTCWLALTSQFFLVRLCTSILSKHFEEQHRLIRNDKYLYTGNIVSLMITMGALYNIYNNLRPRMVGLQAGLKFWVIKVVVTVVVVQELVLHILVRDGVIDSLYCHGTDDTECSGSKSGFSQICYEECSPKVPSSGVRSVALVVIAEMVIASLFILYAYSDRDTCVVSHPLRNWYKGRYIVHENDHVVPKILVDHMTLGQKLAQIFSFWDMNSSLLTVEERTLNGDKGGAEGILASEEGSGGGAGDGDGSGAARQPQAVSYTGRSGESKDGSERAYQPFLGEAEVLGSGMS